MYLPNAVIGMAADQVQDELPKSILDPTSFASVAQLLDRDGYRLDSEYNRTSAEFLCGSKYPSDLLLTSGQYHKSGSDQRNDSATRDLSHRLMVRIKAILATRILPNLVPLIAA